MADPCTSLYRLRHLVCFMFLDWLSHLGMDSNPQIGFVRAYIVLFILLLYNVLNVSFCDGPLSIVHCRCVRACVNNCDGPSSIVHCRCDNSVFQGVFQNDTFTFNKQFDKENDCVDEPVITKPHHWRRLFITFYIVNLLLFIKNKNSTYLMK